MKRKCNKFGKEIYFEDSFGNLIEKKYINNKKIEEIVYKNNIFQYKIIFTEKNNNISIKIIDKDNLTYYSDESNYSVIGFMNKFNLRKIIYNE